MTGRLTACLVGLALLCAGLAAPAQEPSTNRDVERSIDEITKPPDYDWLRAPEGDRVARRDRPERRPERHREPSSRPRRERPEQQDSCAYEPEQQDGPEPADRPLPQGEGCGSGGVPGGEVQSGPVSGDAPGEGCGGGPAMGDCGCDRALGDCGCDRALGSPGSCAGLGAAGTGLGYVLGAVALGLIVFLVVRAILRRDRSAKDAGIEEDSEATGPEEMRVSEVAVIPANTMMDRAARAAAEGDYRTAVGWAYLAGLSALHRAGFTDLRISSTNMAIVASTRRRGGPHGPAARLVRVFEELFFGGRAAGLQHWEECRKIVEEDLVEAPAH